MLLLTTLLIVTHSSLALKIGSYNLYLLSDNVLVNFVDPKLLDTIVQVFLRNDITAIQGVESVTTFPTILRELRKVNSNWDISFSKPLQRQNTSVPEHLGFVFRSDLVQVTTLMPFNDTGDHFERDPFSALIKAQSTPPFVLTSVHLNHLDTSREMALLPAAFSQISAFYNNTNVMMAGDFNADLPFLTKQEFDTAKVTTDPAFDWILDQDQDTWTGTDQSSSFAHFLVSGRELQQAALASPARVVDIMAEYQLTELEAKFISLILPIEIDLQDNFVVVG